MNRPRRRRLTGNEARARVEKLRMRPAPSRTARETLDQPIDPGVQVTGGFPHYKLSLVLDGEARSSLTVTAFEQQIGSATVRMGGVGAEPEFLCHDVGRSSGEDREGGRRG